MLLLRICYFSVVKYFVAYIMNLFYTFPLLQSSCRSFAVNVFSSMSNDQLYKAIHKLKLEKGCVAKETAEY